MAVDDSLVDDFQRELLKHLRGAVEHAATEDENQIVATSTITYGDLIRRTGRKLPPNGIGKHLTIIGNRCVEAGDPRLDYLVVTQKTRKPGFAIEDELWRKEVVACFRSSSFK